MELKQDSNQKWPNYRPVSLTSIVVKQSETIVKPILLNHLICNNIIHDRQSGFLPNKLCVTSLLEVLDEWSFSIDMGLPIDVIYIDFEKAFDKVKHNLLIDKMEVVGVRDQLLQWFDSYLSKRKQRVKLEE